MFHKDNCFNNSQEINKDEIEISNTPLWIYFLALQKPIQSILKSFKTDITCLIVISVFLVLKPDCKAQTILSYIKKELEINKKK